MVKGLLKRSVRVGYGFYKGSKKFYKAIGVKFRALDRGQNRVWGRIWGLGIGEFMV